MAVPDGGEAFPMSHTAPAPEGTGSRMELELEVAEAEVSLEQKPAGSGLRQATRGSL